MGFQPPKMKNFSGGGPRTPPPPTLFWTQVKSAVGKSLSSSENDGEKLRKKRLETDKLNCPRRSVSETLKTLSSPRCFDFSPLHPYTHRTQRLVWVPWCDSRNRASQYQIEAASWQRRADRMRAE